MTIFNFVFKSLLNRKFTAFLTVLSIALGVSLFVSIERVRVGARESFSGAISKVDLLVGPRTGSLPLLLYSVFRIGQATNNISYKSFEYFKKHPAVNWAIPYSLGDSHRGFRVVATDQNFFEYYKYYGDRSLKFSEGHAFANFFEVVIGSEIAEKLKYSINLPIVLAHGTSDDGANLFEHKDHPFKVVGILEKTGTPIDRSLYISLPAMEFIHTGWSDGVPPDVPLESEKIKNLEVKEITSFFLGLKSRLDVLTLQREISNFKNEPLMSIIPGIALAELWNGLSYAENTLKIISIFVVVVGLLGLVTSLTLSLQTRRREMAILRALGAPASKIFSLLLIEALVIVVAGICLGLCMGTGGLYLLQGVIMDWFGLHIPLGGMVETEWFYLAFILIGGILSGVIPAIQAYKTALLDGLSLKI